MSTGGVPPCGVSYTRTATPSRHRPPPAPHDQGLRQREPRRLSPASMAKSLHRGRGRALWACPTPWLGPGSAARTLPLQPAFESSVKMERHGSSPLRIGKAFRRQGNTYCRPGCSMNRHRVTNGPSDQLIESSCAEIECRNSGVRRSNKSAVVSAERSSPDYDTGSDSLRCT